MAADLGLWNSLDSSRLQSLSSGWCSRGRGRQRSFLGTELFLWLSLWKKEMEISFTRKAFASMLTPHCLELRMQRSCWGTLPQAEHSFCPWNMEFQFFCSFCWTFPPDRVRRWWSKVGLWSSFACWQFSNLVGEDSWRLIRMSIATRMTD